MSEELPSGWLGYSAEDGRHLRVADLGRRVALLGGEAKVLAGLVSVAYAESGTGTMVLDLDGSMPPEARGHFRRIDYRSLLYDAFRIEGEDCTHGQLMAAAYSAVLELSSVEEAVIDAALLILAEGQEMATPPALFDVLGAVQGFSRGDVDGVKGRIGAMRLMDASNDESFVSLLSARALVCFGGAPYPLAAELACALFLAKLLWLLRTDGSPLGSIVVTGAHSLFRIPRWTGGRNRKLLTHLLEADISLVIASTLPALLDEKVVECMPTKIYSGEAWNAFKVKGRTAALPSSYVISNELNAITGSFIPRRLKAKIAESTISTPAAITLLPQQVRELRIRIIEEIGRSDSVTRQSLIAYLTPQFLSIDVAYELDRLQREGYLAEEMKRAEKDRSIFAYSVTESGRRLLSEMKR